MAVEPVKEKKVKKKVGRKRNYINNPELHEAMCLFISDLNKDPDTKIPKYISSGITHIVNRFSNHPHFINYPYKSEMIGDAMLTCFQRIGNYDPHAKAIRGENIGKLSKNPLAYFTQIAYHAFINRINIEKKQMNIRLRVAIHEGRSVEFLKSAASIFGMDEVQIEKYMNEHFEETVDKRQKKYNGATLVSFFI